MPAESKGSYGMARRMRTIMLLVAVSAALAAVSQPASAAADVGDVLGILGGGQPQPTPTPPPPSRPQPSGGGGAQSVSQPAGPPKDPLLAPESSCPGQTDLGLRLAAQERAMVCMQNYARSASGLAPLRTNKPLRVSAIDKARDIRRCQVLSHEACGRDPSYWFARVGFLKGAWVAGEVLAYGGGQRGTVRSTMRSWLDSKPHRAVLLDRRFNLVGVGVLTGTFHGFRGTRIWVGHLGYRH
jgi:uncharacterized protein YkwD